MCSLLSHTKKALSTFLSLYRGYFDKVEKLGNFIDMAGP